MYKPQLIEEAFDLVRWRRKSCGTIKAVIYKRKIGMDTTISKYTPSHIHMQNTM